MSSSRTSQKGSSTMSGDGNDTRDSISFQDQILLNALQDFFVPLIRTVANTRGVSATSYRRTTGPEAIKLISALKEFVSSIVGNSEPEEKTTIKVELDAVKGGIAGFFKVPTSLDDPINRSEKYFFNPIHFQERLLRGLREHVFNKMPIRMLCLEPVGSNLAISMIERGTIYRYLEGTVLADYNLGGYHIPIPNGSFISEEDAIQWVISQHAQYAILSHTWLRDSPEITYGDWNKGQFTTDGPGYDKLVNFCKVAWKDYGITLAWMDTLCINKDSSSELDESIRSMYAWYERAKICIAFLSESQAPSKMPFDPWFTRGWTLQELLAPDTLKFYNRSWEKFAQNQNDKKDPTIMAYVTQATTISIEEFKDIHRVPLSRRMQLAASRNVTREEDTAYSLMGIFNVSITIAYGEGANKAFSRLLQQILGSTSDGVLDLLNWAGPVSRMPRITRLFPPSPQQYVHRTTEISLADIQPLEPLTLTHMGLRIPILLLPATEASKSRFPPQSIGDYCANVLVEIQTGVLQRSGSAPLWTIGAYTYDILARRASNSATDTPRSPTRRTFGVYNISQGVNGVIIPPICTAFLLECSQHAGHVTSTGKIKKVDTEASIVFNMKRKNGPGLIEFPNGEYDGEEIPIDGLVKHGMQLISIYL